MPLSMTFTCTMLLPCLVVVFVCHLICAARLNPDKNEDALGWAMRCDDVNSRRQWNCRNSRSPSLVV